MESWMNFRVGQAKWALTVSSGVFDHRAKPVQEVVASSSALAKHVTGATTRFISSFRGRKIHGLKVVLPAGYGGLVLRVDGGANVKDKAKAGSGESRMNRAYMEVGEDRWQDRLVL